MRDDRLLAGPVLGGRTADCVAGVTTLSWYSTHKTKLNCFALFDLIAALTQNGSLSVLQRLFLVTSSSRHVSYIFCIEYKILLAVAGLGLGMLVISFIGCVFFNMIIAWSLYYLFASFTSELPWSHCGNDFNTDRKNDDV